MFLIRTYGGSVCNTVEETVTTFFPNLNALVAFSTVNLTKSAIS